MLIFFPLAFHMLDLAMPGKGQSRSFFGVDPSTAAPLFRDLRDNFPSFRYKDGLMTLNWLWLNNKQSVLSGRWGCCEEYIDPTVKTYAKMIQSLKKKKTSLCLLMGRGT